MKHIDFSEEICCIILDISRPAFDRPVFFTMDFLQPLAVNVRCSHHFIFLAWYVLVPTIATSSAVISLPCLATAMIYHCRSEKSRLFLDVKLEAKAQHCHQTSCQTFTLGETSTNMGKHRFHQAHNLKYILLFITILAVFGPLDPLNMS